MDKGKIFMLNNVSISIEYFKLLYFCIVVYATISKNN